MITPLHALPTYPSSLKFLQVPSFSQANQYLLHQPSGVQSSTSLIHHFGIGVALLQELIDSTPPHGFEVTRCTDVFYDTQDYKLAMSGLWLRKRSFESRQPVKYEWSLKIASVEELKKRNSLDEILSVEEIKDTKAIEEYLLKAGLPPLPERNLTTLLPLVAIDFARFYVSRSDRSAQHYLWVDCARIGSKYHVLGGCSFHDFGGEEAVLNLTTSTKKLLDHEGYFAPVRTKVIAAIQHAHPELYKKLVEMQIIHEDNKYGQAHCYPSAPGCFAEAFVYGDDDE